MSGTQRSFGEEVKHLRLENDLGLREFAKMVPISPAYLIDIEKNNRVPSADVIEKIAKALSYDADKLLTLAQKISPGTEKFVKEDATLGILLRKAKEAGFNDWKAVEKIIEDKKKSDEKNH